MSKRLMCDSCLKEVAYKLTREEMLILEWMCKTKILNQQLAVDKDRILSVANTGLTTFKINIALARLELVNILDVIISGRNKKYFITEDGLQLLNIYKKDLIEKARSISK